ncbi:hypothetical protein UZ36_03085 [Candidatus Nitromaritima sp. SCGC AAA799-C22]|nr:hypothetical protein UZ36_03085 [Candidatus Nitromaritima sp. SCGC AAA799-C22]
MVNLITGISGCEIAGQNSSFNETARLILEIEPDAILLNPALEGGSGMDLLKLIRKVGLKTKVIFMANFPYPQLHKRSLEEGADLFVCKSEAMEKIVEALSEWGREKTGKPIEHLKDK